MRAPHARFHRTRPWTRIWRTTRLVAHFFAGCLIQALVFPLVSRRMELRIIGWWSRRILAILAVRVHVKGRPPSAREPAILVSNHVSWLDIWLIHAVCPVRFVAKSDIRDWPLVGWLVSRAGTIYIERTRRRDTARTNEAIGQVLRHGEHVGMFPEGTTSDGTQLRAFHPSLFQPALVLKAKVAMAAIRYPNADGSPNLDAAYADDRSLRESLKLILRHRVLHAEVLFLGAMETEGRTRRELARETHAVIATALGFAVPGSAPEKASDRADETP